MPQKSVGGGHDGSEHQMTFELVSKEAGILELDGFNAVEVLDGILGRRITTGWGSLGSGLRRLAGLGLWRG